MLDFKKPKKFLYSILILFVFIFGGWASIIPIDGAVIASGSLETEGARRSIQHLEGGIIKKFHIEPGSFVEVGDVLIELDSLRSEIEKERLLQRLDLLENTVIRLKSEIDGSVPDFDHVSENATNQQKLWDARQVIRSRTLKLIHDQIKQTESEIRISDVRIRNVEEKINLLKKELSLQEELLEKGLSVRAKINEHKIDLQESKISKSEILAEKKRLAQSIIQLNREIVSLEKGLVEEASGEITQISSEISDIKEQLRSLEDNIARSVVLSPVSGMVIKFPWRTAGAVLKPGDLVAEIAPTNETFIAKARVSPMDADIVQPGQDVDISLLALDQKEIPKISGKVKYFASDLDTNLETGESWHETAIEINQDDIQKYVLNEKFIAGMPVEAYLKTEPRTLLQYLTDPLFKSFDRSFR